MSDKKEVYDKKIKDYIDEITTPIFNKALQETKKNHSMVVSKQKPKKKTVTPSLYNPHNYRLYFKFTKEKYTPKEGMVGVWFGKLKNYGKEFTAVGEGVRVTVKKVQVEVINKLSEEEWFYINRIKAKEEIAAVLNKIDNKCINSLKKFIEVYGGRCDFKIIKTEGRPNLNLFTKSDNKVMKEPIIDNLALDMAFDTKTVKKVYKKPNVEFKEPIYAATYLENSALNEFSPEIAGSINNLSNTINKIADKFGSTLTGIIPVLNQLTNMNIEITKLRRDVTKIQRKRKPIINNKDLRKWQ
jgi:6-pyruvoyl-tetrahydropterin synthase